MPPWWYYLKSREYVHICKMCCTWYQCSHRADESERKPVFSIVCVFVCTHQAAISALSSAIDSNQPAGGKTGPLQPHTHTHTHIHSCAATQGWLTWAENMNKSADFWNKANTEMERNRVKKERDAKTVKFIISAFKMHFTYICAGE